MDINKALELIQSKLLLWLREFVRLLPNLVLAVLVIVLGFFLAKVIRKFTKKILGKFSHITTLTDLFGSFVYLLCIGVTIFIALSIVKLDKAVTTMLAGVGIVGLALAFAFQDIAANFMSGIFLSFRRPLRIGDIVKLKDYMGKVEAINLRDTVVQTFQGQMVIIPNKEVFQNAIENFSLLGRRRMDLVVGVSYGDDLEKVKQVTLEAVSGISGLSKDEKTTLFFQEFADSSINFTVRLWIATPDQPAYLQVRHEAILQIKKAFDENGISIPFPIRTLDFDAKGGTALSEMPLQIKK